MATIDNSLYGRTLAHVGQTPSERFSEHERGKVRARRCQRKIVGYTYSPITSLQTRHPEDLGDPTTLDSRFFCTSNTMQAYAHTWVPRPRLRMLVICCAVTGGERLAPDVPISKVPLVNAKVEFGLTHLPSSLPPSSETYVPKMHCHAGARIRLQEADPKHMISKCTCTKEAQ